MHHYLQLFIIKILFDSWLTLICVDNGVIAYIGVQHVLLKCVIHEVNVMKLSNIVTVIILAISSTLTPQAMADKLIPETDAELLVWSDATSVEYMKYAAKEFNKDFGYKVSLHFAI